MIIFYSLRSFHQSAELNANIPDDDIVGDNPWTSKHIVDMLCPPIEETGNPVQCYPVPGYPLGITASWEPVQEGSGDPSPDNIRPIKGRDSVMVTRCGKNLIDISSVVGGIISGLIFEKSKEGIYVHGTANANSYITLMGGYNTSDFGYPKFLEPGKTYATNARVALYIYYSDGSTATVKNKTSFTAPSDIGVKTFGIFLFFESGESVDKTFQPMLMLGDTLPAEYIPYQSDTATLSLPETVYCGNVDIAIGTGQKEWELITLTGTEPWSIATTGDYYVWWAYSNIPTTADINVGLCSHYKYQTNKNFEQSLNVQPNGAVVAWHVNDTFESVEDWKAYLASQYAAGTPVQIAYKLATPTTFQASGGKGMSALSDINTILTDADSLVITGRKDPVRLLTGLDA